MATSDTVSQSRRLDPAANTAGMTPPTGMKKMDAGVVTDNCVCNGSTMGSSTVPSRVGGGSAIPGGKSPAIAKPARMRNR